MGKRSTPKKRGIQRGVAKYKIRSKPLKEREHQRTLMGIPESFYFSVGKNCFECWFFCCSKLYLLPFTRTLHGEYVPLQGKSKRIHYLVRFIKFLVLVYKTWGLGRMLLYDEVKTETFLCISLFLISFVSFCLSLVLFARPQETMDLLNCWPLVLSSLRELGVEHVPSPFDDISEAIKLVTVMIASQGIVLGSSFGVLIYNNLPVCYYPTFERLGLIPQGVLPPFAWQLIFVPLEYATNLPPILTATVVCGIFLIFLGIFKILSSEMR